MSLQAATREEVARVLGRAAFGATAADLDRWTGRPYAELVSYLVDFPPRDQRGPAPDDGRRAAIQSAGQTQNQQQGGLTEQAQLWWLERMRTASFPLEERMTLFWHGHFATSLRDPFPDVAMMMVQNETLRRHALGNFRELVAAVSVDAAMLEWLDGARSTIPTPNENFARELFELFTLGKYPQVFGEADVREAARALTGWAVNRLFQSSSFDKRFHDTGTKTILGRTIANADATEYRDVIEVALSHAVSPRFIAYKLVSNFGYVSSNANLLSGADPLVTAVADRLRATDWNIREAVRTMLLSDQFRVGDARASQQLVRQPVELVVAAGKALNFTMARPEVAHHLIRMGQQLFLPPNVGGWPTGAGWLSPSTVIGRYQFGVYAQPLANVSLPGSSDLDGWARLLGMASPTDVTAAALRSFLAEQGKQNEDLKQASVMILMLTSPEWAVL